MTFTEELKQLIQEKPMLQHPFYQMWTMGTLPKEVLQRYADQYIHLEENFPRFLSAMHTNCDALDARRAITQNLYDEEGGPVTHREMWLRFGEGIGTTRENMEHSTALPETQAAVDTFMELSEHSYLEGTAALAAYEDQLPEVSKEKIDGLQKHYNVTDKRTTQFFDVHGVVDVDHANAWWEILEQYANTEEKKEAVRGAVVRGRDALWNFLNGVCREYLPEAVA